MNTKTDTGNHFKYELFFELSPDLLCIAGYDGFFKKINHAVSEVLGYSAEELYSKPINSFVYNEDQDMTAMVRKQLTKHKPLFNFENRYVTKTGEIVWLAWTSLPVESDRLIFAIAKNITHKKRLETDRNLLLANLTKVNEDLKRLTYTTAHDLRSPVNNLLSTFNMIDTSKIRDSQTVDFIEVLKMSGEGLKKTLNNYVDLLITKDGLNTGIEELELNEFLQPVLHSVGALIQSSKATVHVDFREVPKVVFNKDYLESIFLNLITNAIKYARPDKSPIISIYSKKVNGVKQLIVRDNGIGFEMDKVKDKIFGLHQKFSDNADSKGIGLYLVYNHIIKLGGQITVKSKVNEGTTFTIAFKD